MAILIPSLSCRCGWTFLGPLKLLVGKGTLPFFLLLFSIGPAALSEAQTISREYQLKSAFLLNFAQFTTWLANTFAETNSPLVIGILGSNPFGSLLEETVRDENWKGHPFAIARYSRLEEIRSCHLLFISRSETRRLDRIATALKGRPILSVADLDDLPNRGIMIRLMTQNNRIRFKISLDSMKAANLSISSKLLRVAELETTQNR